MWDRGERERAGRQGDAEWEMKAYASSRMDKAAVSTRVPPQVGQHALRDEASSPAPSGRVSDVVADYGQDQVRALPKLGLVDGLGDSSAPRCEHVSYRRGQ